MTKIKYCVEVKQNLTECDSFNEETHGGPVCRDLFKEFYDTLDEAMERYNAHKTMLCFAGLAGQYVCYPYKVEVAE